MTGKLTLLCLVALAPLAAQTATQHKKEIVEDRVVVFNTPAAAPGEGPVMKTMHFSSEVVRNAPYSAEAVTETTQTLADGNRITSKTVNREYRDSDGRTRQDSTLNLLGPWVQDGKTSTISSIHDPVSGEHFTLDHSHKTATKSGVRLKAALTHSPAAGERQEIHVEVRKEAGGGSGETVTFVGARPPVMMWQAVEARVPGSTPAKTESLGKRVMEGLECEGIRETVTIPAGQIGNERPIEIVTERWRAPALQVDVLRRHSDPRFGETAYRLQSVQRGAQPRSLFEVPPDYKTENIGGASEVRIIKEKD